jgi:hypothetical protein
MISIQDTGDMTDICRFVPIIIIIMMLAIIILEMLEKKLIILHADAIITRYTL